ncbi:hypothetical protein P879_01677 [Paragonimus westermani]|uniref:Uncharacterized protein n=1 Tax=Paragonimus westermani TaxID=34504 RepID=A0A8T0DV86_9TREM|nr:hypothetical protein P879_01677 [Paragonimus westermani]
MWRDYVVDSLYDAERTKNLTPALFQALANRKHGGYCVSSASLLNESQTSHWSAQDDQLIHYRVRTCLITHPEICSTAITINEGGSKTWNKMWIVLTCILLPAASVLGLLFALLRWRKQRLISNQVWIPRTRKKKCSTTRLKLERPLEDNTQHPMVFNESSDLPLSRIPSSISFHSPVYKKSPSEQELMNCPMSSYSVSSSDKDILQTQYLQEFTNPLVHPPISFCPILVDSSLSIAMGGGQLDTVIQANSLPCSSSSQAPSVLLIPASQFSSLQLATSKTTENGTSLPFFVHLPVSPISSSTGDGNKTGNSYCS